MKSIWKGSIAFGLVNIPIRLYSATETVGITTHMLHKKDLSRIRFQRVAESTGKEVSAEDIVRGYEVEKGQYVILSDEELEEVAPAKSTGIEIQEFVNESEISTCTLRSRITSNPTKVRQKPMLCCGKRWQSPERWGLPNLFCATEKVFAS